MLAWLTWPLTSDKLDSSSNSEQHPEISLASKSTAVVFAMSSFFPSVPQWVQHVQYSCSSSFLHLTGTTSCSISSSPHGIHLLYISPSLTENLTPIPVSSSCSDCLIFSNVTSCSCSFWNTSGVTHRSLVTSFLSLYFHHISFHLFSSVAMQDP